MVFFSVTDFQDQFNNKNVSEWRMKLIHAVSCILE